MNSRPVTSVLALASIALLASCQVFQGGPTAEKETAAASAAGSSASMAPFPPEDVDHLGMTVAIGATIFGIGEDTIVLKGDVAIHRSGPTGPDGRKMIGDMIGASFRGKSSVFGEVVAFQSPIQHSRCEYMYEGPGRYRGRFDINGWFWLPEHNLLVYSAAPVQVEGTAARIPPVGQKAELTVKEIPLHDLHKPGSNAIGFVSKASGEIHDVVRIEAHLKEKEATVPSLQKKP